MNASMRNKVVLITGGTSGIGLAVASEFLDADAKVVITGRNRKNGENALTALKTDKRNHEVAFFESNVSVADEVKNLIQFVVKTFGKLDIAFNNAGIEGRFAPVDELSEAEFDSVVDVNLKGVWLCCKYEIEQFKKQHTPGVIVNTSSWLARGAFPGSAVYSASKAALDGLVRVLAVEGASAGIRANNIQPGYIRTAMFDRFFPQPNANELMAPLMKHAPIGRFGTPEEVARVVLWLASDNSAFVSGESILVDGGLAIPGQRI